MMMKDRALLAGAWLIIAAVGVFGIWKTATAPQGDVRLARLEKQINDRIIGKPFYPGPSPVPSSAQVICKYPSVPPVAHPVNDKAAYFLPEIVGVPMPRRIVEVHVLSLTAAEVKAAVDLDGVALTWTTQETSPKLEKHMKRVTAKPTGFVVRRQHEAGPVEELQRLDVKARSYRDPTTEPNRTYRYWVGLLGRETDLADPKLEPKDVAKGPADPVEVRCPSATRVKLLGGDTTRAILMVETYNRAKSCWAAKIVPAVPGAAVGASGWTLVGLKFDKFTIVAELKDENGVERILSTKN